MLPNATPPRAKTAQSRNARSAALRNALLLGTILGAGAIVLPSIGRAEVISISAPVNTTAAAVVSATEGSDDLSIETSAAVTSTGNAGIVATRGSIILPKLERVFLPSLVRGLSPFQEPGRQAPLVGRLMP